MLRRVIMEHASQHSSLKSFSPIRTLAVHATRHQFRGLGTLVAPPRIMGRGRNRGRGRGRSAVRQASSPAPERRLRAKSPAPGTFDDAVRTGKFISVTESFYPSGRCFKNCEYIEVDWLGAPILSCGALFRVFDHVSSKHRHVGYFAEPVTAASEESRANLRTMGEASPTREVILHFCPYGASPRGLRLRRHRRLRPSRLWRAPSAAGQLP